MGCGAGHPGTNGVPALTATANPVLGTAIGIQVGSSSTTPTTGALLMGFAPLSQQTPFGGTLLVQAIADVTLPGLPPGGTTVPLAVPSDPMLCGQSVFFQSLVLDGGASHAIAFSAGLELVLGS